VRLSYGSFRDDERLPRLWAFLKMLFASSFALENQARRDSECMIVGMVVRYRDLFASAEHDRKPAGLIAC
jgi:hypothetical protein